MKTFFALLVLLMFASCKQEVITLPAGPAPLKKEKLTFFYTVYDTLVNGQTVWGRAKHFYGNGQTWDSIVSQNSFLKEKGRISQDSAGIWYALVRPKEVLKIGQKYETVVAFVEPPAKIERNNFFPKGTLLSYVLIIFISIIIMAIVIALIIYLTKKKPATTFTDDPTKEGLPYIQDGIDNEDDAKAHFIDLAQMQDQSLLASNIKVTEVEEVFISTRFGKEARVGFANGTSKLLIFRNTPGWKARVSRDKGLTFRTEAFFQACANPIYNDESMLEENLIFSKRPILFDGEEQKETLDEKDSKEKANEESAVLKSEIIEAKAEPESKKENEPTPQVAKPEARFQASEIAEIITALKEPGLYKLTYKVATTEGGWKSRLKVVTKSEKRQ